MPFPAFPPRPATRLSSHGLRKLLVLSAAAIVSSCAQLPSVEDAEARQRAELAEQARQAARPASLCSADPGSPFGLRKKVLVLGSVIKTPSEAADLPGLAASWSKTLQQQLQMTDRFLIRDGHRYQLEPNTDTRQQVISLAQRFDAQFVITTDITTVSIERGRIELGVLKPLPVPFKDKREISTAIQVFDGSSGVLLKQFNHHDESRGHTDNSRPLFQRDFLATPLGQALERIITQQREAVEDELACIPMQARVTRVHRREAHIDAGFSSNLVPGDRLKIYVRRAYNDSSSTRADWTEEVYGELILTKVFPESATGTFDVPIADELESGSYVRAW